MRLLEQLDMSAEDIKMSIDWEGKPAALSVFLDFVPFFSVVTLILLIVLFYISISGFVRHEFSASKSNTKISNGGK
ncbi:hypothetical protein [Bacillus sp. AFS040349]|uniref:hypothetical protein n=1 Tax=Bacillus sp. AFS040349 TaxID=2033502 RepID=UPI000BFB1CF9|nr:hypothetical protein [Bacillus sp. AFS040349]PGT83294.1 hypothetical protein COD11_13240 [Bacillus sp. AFS040349]